MKSRRSAAQRQGCAARTHADAQDIVEAYHSVQQDGATTGFMAVLDMLQLILVAIDRIDISINELTDLLSENRSLMPNNKAE